MSVRMLRSETYATTVLYSPVGIPTERTGMKEKNEVWQGTLAIMVLKTLDVLGPQHGYGIARRIDQISDNLLSVNHGTLYPVLLKLEQEGSITSEWGVSENNRKAKFYRLSKAGKKALQSEKRQWEQTTEIVARFFALESGTQ
jgi:PadR family transcriptional regulator, regulatory protein PadR